ncbi:MAG: hypothetical protein KBA53_02535 [Thermoclostridium sp.]|nr:hypothetical protein [Thermoclostridium sp.]
MKTMKSKQLFIISIIVVAIFLVGGLGVVIRLFTQRTKPTQATVQNSPTPSKALNAATTQAPGEPIQSPVHDGQEQGQQEPMQTQPSESPIPTNLPEATPEASPLAQPDQGIISPEQEAAGLEQGVAGLEQGVENPDQQATEPTPAAAASIQLISREEAGLDTIPKLNFESFALNKRIRELLLEGVSYTNEDMKSGIESPYLITDRFQEPIIEDITIGTSIEEVIRVLGEPSFQERNMTVYKTEDYYIGFYGAETVELANFLPVPQPCGEDILKTILTALSIDATPLTELLDNKDIAGFFEENGSIHGGGFYVSSSRGVKAESFDYETIEIYNNFEGLLYQVSDGAAFIPAYTNIDSNLDSLYAGFLSYTTNDDFMKEGKLSPSGKYIAKYEWITSMHHYFTIRTTDHSAPDYQIGAVANHYEWLNDDYIVYTAMFTSLPAIIRVTEDMEGSENILLMDGIDQMDYFYHYGDYDFTIDEITTETIRFKDNKKAETDEGTYWEVRYIIDDTGRFQVVK